MKRDWNKIILFSIPVLLIVLVILGIVFSLGDDEKAKTTHKHSEVASKNVDVDKQKSEDENNDASTVDKENDTINYANKEGNRKYLEDIDEIRFKAEGGLKIARTLFDETMKDKEVAHTLEWETTYNKIYELFQNLYDQTVSLHVPSGFKEINDTMLHGLDLINESKDKFHDTFFDDPSAETQTTQLLDMASNVFDTLDSMVQQAFYDVNNN